MAQGDGAYVAVADDDDFEAAVRKHSKVQAGAAVNGDQSTLTIAGEEGVEKKTEQRDSRRTLCCSFLSLLFSIPAIIGA